MARILVLVLSGPESGGRVAAALGFAARAHDLGAEVRVVFFADGVRVALEGERYPELARGLAELARRGLTPLVCRRNLEALGREPVLSGFAVRYIGADLVQAAEDGFTVFSF